MRGWEVGGGIGRHRREIPSVADAIDKFLVDAESRELKATSVRKYRHFLKKQVLPFSVLLRRTRLQQFDVRGATCVPRLVEVQGEHAAEEA